MASNGLSLDEIELQNGKMPKYGNGRLRHTTTTSNDSVKHSRISFSIHEPESEQDPTSNSSFSFLTFADFLLRARVNLKDFRENNSKIINISFHALIIALLNIYILFALIVSPEKACFVAPVFYFVLLFVLFRKFLKWKQNKARMKSTEELQDLFEHSLIYQLLGYLKMIILIVLWIFIVLILAKSCIDDINSVFPITGLLLLVTICFICSKKPQLVKVTTILWGLAIQILAGYSIVRTNFGNSVFETMSEWARSFFSFSAHGSRFVFGDLYDSTIFGEAAESYFVFAIHGLPLIIFLNSVVSVLYYLGIMQVVIKSIAYLLKITLGTSVPETLSAAANIFLGQVESPLIILPYLNRLSLSELHAVMCGGFATVAASVLGVYLKMEGINSTHLVAASVLNAPASLVFAKIVLPEDPRDYHRSIEQVDFSQSKEKNVVEAISNGACAAIPICLSMCATIIAFLSILAFLNATLGFFGELVGHPDFNLELLLGYVFYPAALLMGLRGTDARIIAQLMGKKFIVNEWVAFNDLSHFVQEGAVSERAAAIGVYALCNFANIGSLGVQLGGLGAVISERKNDLIKASWSALFCGALASISNACIIAALYQEEISDHVWLNVSNQTNVLP